MSQSFKDALLRLESPDCLPPKSPDHQFALGSLPRWRGITLPLSGPVPSRVVFSLPTNMSRSEPKAPLKHRARRLEMQD